MTASDIFQKKVLKDFQLEQKKMIAAGLDYKHFTSAKYLCMSHFKSV